ncbi:MAG: SDR family oxidoreductase [Fimbriimonadaceae bacterium]|nr:SDR family oxidoreductase [Chitinophagales bacterium]
MFQNKVIWVTGASSGIGKELALQFAKGKSWLILSARSIEALEQTKKDCLQFTDKIEILPLDLSDTASLKNISEKALALFGTIDILINNGGISQRSDAINTPLEIDRKIMEVNYFGNIALTKHVLPVMQKNNGGKIVVISSMSGKFGWKQRTAYAASKFALQGFYESLRSEIQKDNITVLIVSPGRIKTNISLNAITKDGTAYNKMDEGQLNGIPVETCAKKIISSIKRNKKEIIIAREERILHLIRKFIPSVYYRMAANRNPNK